MIHVKYAPVTVLTLRLIDIVLTKAAIRGLGELSGEEIETLYSIRQSFVQHDDKLPSQGFDPAHRKVEEWLQEVEVEIKTSDVQFMLNGIFGKMKAFGAGDIDQVIWIRRSLQAAFENAKIVPDSDAEEVSD